jgi:ribosome-binding factor A
MSGASRSRRVNEVIRQVIAEAVQRDLSDPRIGFVTITAVDTNRDQTAAKVYFSTLSPDDRDDSAAALRSAAGLLQSRVGAALKTKNTPQLTFVYDELPEQAADLTRLIDGVAPEPEDR